MSTEKKSVSRSKQAKLTLSVSRVENMYRKKKYCKKYSRDCAVFLTGVLEYVATVIIKASAGADTKRIQPKTLSSGVSSNLQLNGLFGNVEIGGSSFQ